MIILVFFGRKITFEVNLRIQSILIYITIYFPHSHREIAEAESEEVLKSIREVIEDLGVCPLPDALPETRLL